MKISIILAHPNPGSFNHAIAGAAAEASAAPLSSDPDRTNIVLRAGIGGLHSAEN